MAAIALELQAFGCGTVQGAGHTGKPGDDSPRAPSPGLPLEEATSARAREGLRRAQRERKRARLLDVLSMVEKAGSFFQDETRLETNPRVGFCWMRKGKHKPL